MIQLDPEKEYLRESLFSAVFGTSLLFDDLESAMAFREQRKQTAGRVASLFTRDGNRIGGEGILDPSAGRGVRPKTLSFIFGAQPPNNTEETRRLVSGMAGYYTRASGVNDIVIHGMY